MGILNTKKGDVITDPIVIFIILIIAGISLFVGLKMLNGYSNNVLALDNNTSSTYSNITSTIQAGAGTGINDGILFGIGLLFIFGLIIASSLNVDPRWLWIGLIFGLVVMWGLWQMRDTFSNAVPTAEFSQERSQAPQAYSALGNIGYLVILFFVLLFIVVYGRISSGGVQ